VGGWKREGTEGGSGSPQGLSFDHKITIQEPAEENAPLKGCAFGACHSRDAAREACKSTRISKL